MSKHDPDDEGDGAQADGEIGAGHDPETADARPGEQPESDQERDGRDHIDDLGERDRGGDGALVDMLAAQVARVDGDVADRRWHRHADERGRKLHEEPAHHGEALGDERREIQRRSEVGDGGAEEGDGEPTEVGLAAVHRRDRPWRIVR